MSYQIQALSAFSLSYHIISCHVMPTTQHNTTRWDTISICCNQPPQNKKIEYKHKHTHNTYKFKYNKTEQLTLSHHYHRTIIFFACVPRNRQLPLLFQLSSVLWMELIPPSKLLGDKDSVLCCYCYVALCYVMLWYAMLCYVMSCYATLFHAVSWDAFCDRLVCK